MAKRSLALKKLYVGNLPFQATEEQLTTLFSQTGVTAANVTLVRDRFSGQPRGFGFVEINNDEEADRAVQGLNGHDFTKPGLRAKAAAVALEAADVVPAAVVALAAVVEADVGPVAVAVDAAQVVVAAEAAAGEAVAAVVAETATAAIAAAVAADAGNLP
jgi:hypothetical protein